MVNLKIAMINGSPKAKNSSSECALQMLKPLLNAECEIIDYKFNKSGLKPEDLKQLLECNVLVLSFPLYVDGVPAHMLDCLYQLETLLKEEGANKLSVYALVNCGFYEGHQTAIALEIIRNWCEKAELKWGQGVGIGGGGMLPMLTGIPDGKGLKKNYTKALKTIADNISISAEAEDIFISPGMPRLAYKLAAEMGWRQQIKANGLRRKDISTKK